MTGIADTLRALAAGFGNALTVPHLAWALVGTVVGTAIGVLPGIGPALTVAVLLPVTFNVEPTSAFIMFGGIYYGAMYGGSTTSILLNTPGETGSIATAIDGHAMARQGRAAAALATAAIGSFVAGTLATLGLTFLAPPLAAAALRFGPAEYFALAAVAFAAALSLLGESLWKGALSLSLGLALGLVGIDQLSGEARFSFGIPQLLDGIDVVILVMGLFAVGEALHQALRYARQPLEPVVLRTGASLTREEWRRSWRPWLRGTAIGFPLGGVAERRHQHPDVPVLCRRTAAEPRPRPVRARCDRGRGWSRGGQQRRGGRRAGPAADAGPAVVGDRGGAAGRVPAVPASSRARSCFRPGPISCGPSSPASTSAT